MFDTFSTDTSSLPEGSYVMVEKSTGEVFDSDSVLVRLDTLSVHERARMVVSPEYARSVAQSDGIPLYMIDSSQASCVDQQAAAWMEITNHPAIRQALADYPDLSGIDAVLTVLDKYASM